MKVEINGNSYNYFQARDAFKYKHGLFPEATSGNRTIDFLVRLSGLNERITGKFYLCLAGDTNQTPKPITLNGIMTKMHGQRGFFKDGGRVLDIGSGAGIAVSQLSSEFPNVQFVGLDHGYTFGFNPTFKDKGMFVGGDWNRLPFRNDSITGILSLESFPTHAEWIWDFPETFKEITRVSKPGAIWRGTHRGSNYDEMVYEGDWAKEMLSQMNRNGWDVAISNSLFVAKLVNKIPQT